MVLTPQSLLDFKGKSVLVTGAGSGMGSGIAARFAEAGADVGIHYHKSADGALSLVSRLKKIGCKAVAFQGDLTKPADVALVMEEVFREFGKLDVLINNAGIYPVTPLLNMSVEEWKAVLDANLTSAFLCVQAAAKKMISAKTAGAIVNILSIEAVNPTANHSHYCAAKAGLHMFSRTAAAELGRNGIRINSVLPGLIWSEGLEKDWADGVSRWMESAPLKRLGQPDDVADACLFLASPAARWITGAELLVDGGMMTGQVY